MKSRIWSIRSKKEKQRNKQTKIADKHRRSTASHKLLVMMPIMLIVTRDKWTHLPTDKIKILFF